MEVKILAAKVDQEVEKIFIAVQISRHQKWPEFDPTFLRQKIFLESD